MKLLKTTFSLSVFIFACNIFISCIQTTSNLPLAEYQKSAPLPNEPQASFPKMVVGDNWVVTAYGGKQLGLDTYIGEVINVDKNGSFDIKVKREKTGDTWARYYDIEDPHVKGILPTDSADGILSFPLFVRKKWEVDGKYKSMSGGYNFYKQFFEVKKIEKIKTDVGEFEVFKIRRSWYNSTLGTNGWSIFWYSPKVKAIIKSKHSGKRGANLVSYKLATDDIAKQSEQQKIIPQPKPSEKQEVVAATDKPKIIMTSERIKIGILEFRSLNKEAKNDELGKVISEMLTTSFVNSDAFKIIEREQLQKVVKEFELSQSGIIDTSDAKKIGKIAGATAIVTGSVVKMGDYIRLDARIIDVESGIILTAEKNEGLVSIKNIGAMTDQIVSNLVNKFYQEKK